MRRRYASVVTLANEQVSIVAVCHSIGVHVPDGVPDGLSIKVHCPFGVYHADQGAEAAFRVYPSTNSAYCFAGCGYFAPVSLFAQARDIADKTQAATDLLDTIGWKPLEYAQLWDEVTRRPDPIDTDALGQALSLYCSRFPAWESAQFESGLPQQTYSRLLALLPKIQDQTDADRWLEAGKRAMERLLGGTP